MPEWRIERSHGSRGWQNRDNTNSLKPGYRSGPCPSVPRRFQDFTGSSIPENCDKRVDATPAVIYLRGHPWVFKVCLQRCAHLRFHRYTTAVSPFTTVHRAMSRQASLIQYLEQEMAVSQAAIALGLRQAGALPNLLPIALWEYGLITTDQLNQIFDRLEALQPGQNSF